MTKNTAQKLCLWSIIIFFIFMLWVFFCRCAAVKQVEQLPQKVMNDRFLDMVSTFTLTAHSYYNSAEDAINFAQGRKVYGVSPLKWHRYKNLSRGYLMSYGFCKGLQIGKAILMHRFRNEIKRQIKRAVLCDASISFQVWQHRYHYIRYKKFPDYTPSHNKHRYVLPVDKDRYLPLNKPYIHGTIDIIMIGSGIYYLIK